MGYSGYADQFTFVSITNRHHDCRRWQSHRDGPLHQTRRFNTNKLWTDRQSPVRPVQVVWCIDLLRNKNTKRSHWCDTVTKILQYHGIGESSYALIKTIKPVYNPVSKSWVANPIFYNLTRLVKDWMKRRKETLVVKDWETKKGYFIYIQNAFVEKTQTIKWQKTRKRMSKTTPITVSFYRTLVVTYISILKHLKLRHPYRNVRHFVRGVTITEHDTFIDNTIYHLVTTTYGRLTS